MNKQELIEIIAAKNNLTKADADRAIKAVLEGITEGLKADKSVQLIGFGTFEVKDRAAREGRNPKTGEKIAIAASQTIGFKAGAGLKKEIV